MPATEETWRSQPLLHRVFAVSGVGLFLATVWMFAADHFREWKPYQRNMVKIDTTLTLMQEEQFKTEENRKTAAALKEKLAAARAAGIDEKLYEQFKREVKEDLEKRNQTHSFESVDAQVAAHNALAKTVEEARRALDKKLADLAKFDKEIALATGELDKLKAGGEEAKPEVAKKESQLKALGEDRTKLAAEVKSAEEGVAEALKEAEKGAEKRLKDIVAALNPLVKTARFHEDQALNTRKLAAAKLDATKAAEGILIRDDRPLVEISEVQSDIVKLQGEFEKLTSEYQKVSTHRKSLQEIIRKLTAAEDEALAAIKKNDAELVLLQKAFRERQSTYFVSDPPFLGKRILELPILDAFGGPRKPDNLWSDGNEINYSHKFVRRFDRCTTCHQAMDKSASDSASEPLYAKEHDVELILATPAEADLAAGDKVDGVEVPRSLDRVYGLRVGGGLLNSSDVTVTLVQFGQLAAKATLAPKADELTPKTGEELRRELLMADHEPPAIPDRPGFLVGDVIVKVNDDEVSSQGQFERLVLGPSVPWGSPVRVTVRRGLPNPYLSHPRLDLFVGSLSPHKLQTFGCTSCHEGQGSATAFKWASHAPNNPDDRKEWSRKYGWFDNHHWIYPQNPLRFLESSCIKCHHNVTELEPSERFPDPPAPKVVHGHDLIRKFGCFGCHEVNGFDGPNKRVGPDMRLEPVFYAVAEELLTHLPERREAFQPQLDELAKRLVPLQDLIKQKIDLEAAKKKIDDKMPPDADKDKQLEPIMMGLADVDKAIGEQKDKLKIELAETSALQAHINRLDETAQLAERLVRYPEEGDIRRKIKQLLEVDRAGKADAFGKTFSPKSYRLIDLLKDIDAPGSLRKPGPSLRHAASKLDPAFLADWIAEPKHFRPSTRMPQFFGLTSHLPAEDIAATKSKERLEVLGIAAYVLDRSQKFEFLKPGEGAEGDKAAAATRGKQQFQTRGCLACHNHQEFPEAQGFRSPTEIVQGPDLSGLAAKFSADRNSDGRKWLYSWIKQPSRYHARTVMPDLFLDVPVDETGKVTGSDPADDIVEYLLSVKYEGWKAPADVVLEGGKFKLTQDEQTELKNLTLDNLKETFFEMAAEDYLAKGIPESKRAELKGAEVELVGKSTEKEWLLYIGRKSIGKYGCYGCHDIPGFEDAKPIGTGLADWGRKDPAKLAFEHIGQYLHAHGGGHEKTKETKADTHDKSGDHAAHAEHHADPLPPFYEDQLNAGNRIGFIFQKLKEPRSYDYHKTENKRYNERLRMPQFPFNDEEREAIVTFVLGLVAEPPTPKYVYSPSPRQKAIAEGRQVLEKFNCGGCHILEMDKWKVAYAGKDEPPPDPADAAKVFPFLRSIETPEELAAARKVDRRGLLRTTLTALPSMRPAAGDDGLPQLLDGEGEEATNEDKYAPITTRASLDLWSPTYWNGQKRKPGDNALKVPMRDLEAHYPSHGGMLAKYLIQPVFQHQKSLDSSAKIAEAWGWLPPPLLREGSKVQAEWLHDFLLDPHPIRPAVVLRMPKFNMSPAEATKLVSYFAAVDNADFPYEFGEQRRESYLNTSEQQYEKLVAGAAGEADARHRLDDAMKIVTTVCVKCHIVGDFYPTGSKLVMGPNLARVDRRLKPNYLRDWIAYPKGILPYTGMPVNVPFDETAPNYGTNIGQDLFHGNSLEQLEGLVDLLANFDEYAKTHRSIKSMVKVAPPPAAVPEKTEKSE